MKKQLNTKFKNFLHKLTKINYQAVLYSLFAIAICSILTFQKGKDVGSQGINQAVKQQKINDAEEYTEEHQTDKRAGLFNDPGDFHPSVVIDKKNLEKRTRRNYPHYSVQTLTIGKKHAKFYQLQTNQHFTTMKLVPVKSYDREDDEYFPTGICTSPKYINYKYADYTVDDYSESSFEDKLDDKHENELENDENASNKSISLDQIANSHCPIPAFTNQKLNNRAVTYLPKDKLTEQEAQPFSIIKPNWYADLRFIRNFWLNSCSDYNNGNVHEIVDYNRHQYFRTAIDGLYLKDTDLSKINGKPIVVVRDGYGNNSIGSIKNTDLKVIHNKEIDNISKLNTIYFAGVKYHGKFNSHFSALAVNKNLFTPAIGGVYRNKATNKTTVLNLGRNVEILERKLPRDYKKYIYSMMCINRITETDIQPVLIPTGKIVSIKTLPVKVAEFDNCDNATLSKINESSERFNLDKNEAIDDANQEIIAEGGDC